MTEDLGVARRDRKDRRPGTPVPFHEPDPNRFALSDAIRARLLREAEEKERKSLSYRRDEADRLKEKGRAAPEPKSRPTLAERLASADIPEPPSMTTNTSAADAEIRATRGDKTLYFASATEAAAAFVSPSLSTEDRYTMEVRYTTILRTYLRDGDGRTTVFGWQWERLVARFGRRDKNAKWK